HDIWIEHTVIANSGISADEDAGIQRDSRSDLDAISQCHKWPDRGVGPDRDVNAFGHFNSHTARGGMAHKELLSHLCEGQRGVGSHDLWKRDLRKMTMDKQRARLDPSANIGGLITCDKGESLRSGLVQAGEGEEGAGAVPMKRSADQLLNLCGSEGGRCGERAHGRLFLLALAGALLGCRGLLRRSQAPLDVSGYGSHSRETSEILIRYLKVKGFFDLIEQLDDRHRVESQIIAQMVGRLN